MGSVSPLVWSQPPPTTTFPPRQVAVEELKFPADPARVTAGPRTTWYPENAVGNVSQVTVPSAFTTLIAEPDAHVCEILFWKAVLSSASSLSESATLLPVL